MTIKYILLAMEIFLLIMFIIPFPIICSGNIAGILFSVCLLLITSRFDGFKSMLKAFRSTGPGKIVIPLAALILIAGFSYVTMLSVKMYKAQENKPDDPNVIVVLGCKVNGERPSRMLRRRLDAAYEALQKHPDVICIVSGGQGSNEKISEAEAMRRYLVEKGIDESRIIKEDKSTSTFENIKFTFDITDKMNLSRDITIITDGFHQYRASLIAKRQGAGEVTAYSAYTGPRLILTYWVREWLGLTHFFLLGN